MSTLSVVERILTEAAIPMSVREIVERAGPSLPTKSKTPDTVVARDLSMDIKKRGEQSLFVRTSPGRYAMRAHYGPGCTPPQRADAPTTSMTTSAVAESRAGVKHKSPPEHRSEQTDTASA